MFEKFRNHKNLKYFFLYCAGNFAYGTHISGLGPFIPYLTAKTGIIETQYSYLFSCRSFAMLLGALAVKIMQAKKVQNHNLLALGAAIICIFSILFSLVETQFWLGLWLFFASFGYTIFEVVVNVCILMVNPPEEVEFWMLVTHGVFGLGALCGPVIVYLFSDYSYLCFGLLVALVIPFYLKIKTPEVDGFAPQIHSPLMKKKTASKKVEILLCLLLFLAMGIQCTYGGWISSYAVLTGITDNQGATKFPTYFWIFMTIFRLGLAYAPGKSSKKFRLLIQGNIISGIIVLALVNWGYLQFACSFSSLLFGLSMSLIYPLIFTYTIEGGLNIEETQTANIVVAGVLGEGILTMFAGHLMEIFGPNMLFWFIIVVAVVMWFSRYYSLLLIQKQLEDIENSKQIQSELIKIKSAKA